MHPTTVVIALGSNLGDRRGHLTWAVEQLEGWLQDLQVSPVLETEPQEVPDIQPRYLNAVVVGRTTQPPRAVLDSLLTLERARGRTRTGIRAARTLDLDLILYGDLTLETPALTLPHPGFRRRRFVLAPLAAVAPDMRDPVTGLTVAELLSRLDRGQAG